ncbi:biopolymer transport protein TolQ [Chitinimonas taiwanensis DSM 18899]|jgi:biopolymer transport protein TolQ|uniref:Tol-Pal system protein TolQ n=2 Tax=Chitinimonas TaxID=240411 RepID=A0A1K2H3Y0_9NEIS|nr:biopolymer transport protein TolQ [Chitinimonas taiwanensis DSM 18899]
MRARRIQHIRNTGLEASLTTHDMSIFSLISNASLVVQLVMLALLLLSLMSWWFIFSKWFSLNHARSKTDQFETSFWGGSDLNSLYQQISRDGHGVGMEKMFEAGFAEFLKLRRQAGMDLSDVMDGTRRAMKAAFQREVDRLDAHANFLATVGSISPYIGLFGTVWGIMNAFLGLSNVGQATLSQVAPGIAEALVATAIGLFAAIPAVVAYNRFAHDVDKLANRFESFMEEFSNILQRQAAK